MLSTLQGNTTPEPSQDTCLSKSVYLLDDGHISTDRQTVGSALESTVDVILASKSLRVVPTLDGDDDTGLNEGL